MKTMSWLAGAAMVLTLGPGVMAQVQGKITLNGEAPEMPEIRMDGVPECQKLHADPVYEEKVITGEDNGLANVIVAIQSDDPGSLGGDVPSEPAVLDQEGCMYHPHVMTLTVGQDLVVKNSDSFMHNVHSLALINPAFNFGQPTKDDGRKPAEQPRATETFHVKCDVHPWMSAYIGVFEHPFHAVTDENGNFTLPEGLPDGEYTVTIWHETYGDKEETLEVTDGKGELNASFDAGSAAAPQTQDMQLASVSDEADCGGMTCCDAESGEQPVAQVEAK